MNKRLKKENGITLVVLIITIIILLILAGITINQLIGSRLFENTRLAKESAESAQKLENETLEEYKNTISEYIDGDRSSISEEVWYPKGTEEEPETISAGQRIEIENPYPGKKLLLTVQIKIGGLWCDPGFTSCGGRGYGVRVTQLEGEDENNNKIDKIVIKSGNRAVVAGDHEAGHGFVSVGDVTSLTVPYRLKIICLD